MPDIKAAKASLINLAEGRVYPQDVARDDYMDSMIADYFNGAADCTLAALKRISNVATGSSAPAELALVRGMLEKHR